MALVYAACQPNLHAWITYYGELLERACSLLMPESCVFASWLFCSLLPGFSEVEMSGKRKKKKQGGGATKRKLRVGGLDRGRAPKSFQRILEDVSACSPCVLKPFQAACCTEQTRGGAVGTSAGLCKFHSNWRAIQLISS